MAYFYFLRNHKLFQAMYEMGVGRDKDKEKGLIMVRLFIQCFRAWIYPVDSDIEGFETEGDMITFYLR